MSWAQDEWKNELPSLALRNIERLEKTVDVLKKDKQQRAFQLDSLESALNFQKKKNEEDKAKNAELARDVNSLSEKCVELGKAKDKIAQDLHTKETRLGVLDSSLQKAKQAYENEVVKNNKIVSELEREQAEKLGLSQKLDKANEERQKLTEMNNIQRQKLSSSGSATTEGIVTLKHRGWDVVKIEEYCIKSWDLENHGQG